MAFGYLEQGTFDLWVYSKSRYQTKRAIHFHRFSVEKVVFPEFDGERYRFGLTFTRHIHQDKFSD